VSFAANDEVENFGDDDSQAPGPKLSRKEQYRLAVMQEKEKIENHGPNPGGPVGGSAGVGLRPPVQPDYPDDEEDEEITQEAVKGAVTHAGVLKKKKRDHGRFEDPYKTVSVA